MDSISSELIISGLKTKFIGKNIVYHPVLTSTMDIAKEEAGKGAVEGTAVIAGKQVAGRGRLARAWTSPAGAIAVSLILRPPLSHLPSLVMVASLAVARTIKNVTGLDAQIRWPNDVLIEGKKVCGVLIENDIRGKKVNHAIIGIGINANVRLADYPEIQPIATSLSDELGRQVSKVDIIQNLFVEIEMLYLGLQSGSSVFEEWRDSLVTLGKAVKVKMGETTYEGLAESVAADGSLILRKPDGELVPVVAGDVALRA